MNNNFKNECISTETNKCVYKCGICGKVHGTIAARAKCETACLKKQEEERKLAAEKKKREEKAARKKEVDDAIKHAQNLVDKFVEDYGVYDCTTTGGSLFNLDDSIIRFLRMLP